MSALCEHPTKSKGDFHELFRLANKLESGLIEVGMVVPTLRMTSPLLKKNTSSKVKAEDDSDLDAVELFFDQMTTCNLR